MNTVQKTQPPSINRGATLILMPMGIGDAVVVGLSAIDQIIRNEPAAFGNIDIVCNNVQADIFSCDPRINSVIEVDNTIFATPDVRTWLKGIFLRPEAMKLISLLRSRHYVAAFPGSTTPIFYRRLGTPIMHMNVVELLRTFLSVRHQADIPISNITRQIVNAHFGNKLAAPAIDEEIPLYISSHHIQQASITIEGIKEQSGIAGKDCRLLLVAPDSASIITRPPIGLLARGIVAALEKKPHLIVCILPGYTDSSSATNLYQALLPGFDGRIFMLPQEPGNQSGGTDGREVTPLLQTTALIDQADIFVTGDTGVMHLAVTSRKRREDDKSCFAPRNAVKIIAVFGGTNPGLYGYCRQTTILGRGRSYTAHQR